MPMALLNKLNWFKKDVFQRLHIVRSRLLYIIGLFLLLFYKTITGLHVCVPSTLKM